MCDCKKVFKHNQTQEEDENDEEVYEDIKCIITDSRLIHLLSDQINELSTKRAATRSDAKRSQYDDDIHRMSEDRSNLINRINKIKESYQPDE